MTERQSDALCWVAIIALAALVVRQWLFTR